MLTQDERNEISQEFGRYERKSAACIEALRIVQKNRRWISDETLRDIAAFLEMSVDEVDGVATFYNLIFRQPVGRHVLFFCDSVSCWVMGCEKLKERLKSRLGIEMGETTTDGRFTALPIACLGACEKAPALLADGELKGNVDVQSLERLLTELKGGGHEH